MSAAAIVALVVGGVGCVALVLVAIGGAILLPVFSQAREKARTSKCQSNLKQLSLGVRLYVQDYDGRLPPAKTWASDLGDTVNISFLLTCPASDRNPAMPGSDYAFNSRLGGLRMQTDLADPAAAPLLFDSDAKQASAAGSASPSGGGRIPPEANISDPLTSFIARHNGDAGGNVLFADGHVKLLSVAPEADAGLSASARRQNELDLQQVPPPGRFPRFPPEVTPKPPAPTE